MPSSARDWSSDVCSSDRSEEHTSELQSRSDLVCRLLLEKKKNTKTHHHRSTDTEIEVDSRTHDAWMQPDHIINDWTLDCHNAVRHRSHIISIVVVPSTIV